MFEIRPDLTKTNILTRVSEIDIFRNYCRNFVKPGVNFCSDPDMRWNRKPDKTPSCRVDNYKGRIVYKDFSEEGMLSCFDYVMKKYRCDYSTALAIINRDFRLGLDGNLEYLQNTDLSTPVINNERYDAIYTGNSEIRVQYRSWGPVHIEYIGSYYLDYRKVSKKFHVNPIAWYWINDWQFKAKKLSFAYYFGVKDGKYLYKVYQPGQNKYKWCHNLDNQVMQGYVQLPESGSSILITKAYKDVWCYDLFDIPSIAPPAEGWEIPDSVMEDICSRFPNRFVQFDFDRTGIIGMNRLKRRYGLKCIPLTNGYFNSINYYQKDFSDFLKYYGFESTEKLVNNVKYKLGLI